MRRAATIGVPALLAGLVAFVLYARTLAPGLSWTHDGSDGGDLLAAALTRGVPHPSGYPTYQILLRGTIALYPGTPARAGNGLSALCAALAVALFADLARRVLSHGTCRALVALSAALCLAASPMLWSQAVITEVYALNALFVVSELWLLWHWREAVAEGRSGGRWLVAAALILGLGMGNHLSLVLLLPGAASWLWTNRRLVGARARWHWPAALIALCFGLAVYAYLPWAASGDPPVNWGDPRTVGRFWNLVAAKIYRPYIFGIVTSDLPGRLSAWVENALRQLGGGPWGALIAFAGLWWFDRHDHAWWRLTALVALTYSIYSIGYSTSDSYLYLIPVWIVAALWFAAGLAWGIESIGSWLQGRRRQLTPRQTASTDPPGHPSGLAQAGLEDCRAVAPTRLSGFLVVLLLIALPAFSIVRFWREMDASQDREAEQFVADVLARAEPGAIILVSGDRSTFALWYAIYGLSRRRDLTPVNVRLYVFDWYRRSLASHHPGVLGTVGEDSRTLQAILMLAARERPLYRADVLEVPLIGFVEHPEGSLVRMSLP